MAGFTTTGTNQGAALIQELYAKGFVTCVYYNGFMDLFPKKPWGGGLGYNWTCKRGGSSSVEVFTEGQAQPGADPQDYAIAQVVWTYVRAMCQITGHAIDAMGSNYAGIDVVDSEINGAAEDVRDLMSTSFLGSTYGLEVAVDSTTTYAGVTRGANSWFESAETSVGDVLAESDLADLLETLRDRGASPRLMLLPWNQYTRLGNIAGVPFLQQEPTRDKGAHRTGLTYAGMDVIGIGDMTDTILVMLDPGNEEIILPVIRPMQVKEMAPSGDADLFQVSSGACFVIKRPHRQGKLVSLTS